MATKSELLVSYDRLSSAIATAKLTIADMARADRQPKEFDSVHLANAIDTVRECGKNLISAMAAPPRNNLDMLAMCDRLLDKSFDFLAKASLATL